jgi:UDP-glucose 4-epimerase
MALYLVTGGCGFIGSHLTDALLARGDDVRILDDLSTGRRENVPAGVEVMVGDVADAALVRRAMAGVAGCFHLAAIASVQRSVEDWLGAHRANLTGAIAVFDAARNAAGPDPVPVVYASSAAVYGDNAAVPLAETATTRPLTAYGADKYGCELHGHVGWHVHHVPNTGMRFFNVYGPRQDPKSPYSGVIAIFAERIAADTEIVINGDGLQVRDFVYVQDVVRHLMAAMQDHPPVARVFNVCTGQATTVLALAEAIGQVAGRVPKLRHGPGRPGDIRLSIGNPAAATAALGIQALTKLVAGLRPTLAEHKR